MDAAAEREIRLRRGLGYTAVVVLLLVDLYATGLFGGGERVLAIVRTLVLPGLPFLEWNIGIGLFTISVALLAIGAWMRWGIDWLPLLVMLVSVGVAAFVMPLHHDQHQPHEHEHEHEHEHAHARHHDATAVLPGYALSGEAADANGTVLKGSHEFTVVLVVFALVARLRLMLARVPGAGWVKSQLPAGMFFPAVDIARAAAVLRLAGVPAAAVQSSLKDPRLRQRARQVNAWARLRIGGDPVSGAHAPLRAALALTGLLDPTQMAALRTEAHRCLAGVPDSEPTWLRPLDGMLAAIALQTLGEEASVARWRTTFDTRFALRHGRRAAALHTPSMLSAGTAATWEHAAATALGRHMGWLGEDDWSVLRPDCLGRSASGAKDVQTWRLVAAGRLWATLVNDREALEILDRRSSGDDALARALDELAQAVQAKRDANIALATA